MDPHASLPIVCELTPDELRARREGLLPSLLGRAVERLPLPEGFRWRFVPEDGLLAALAETLDAERRCCRFLRFTLTVEPAGGPVWLEVTGPPGTAEFLATLTRA